MKKLFSLPAFVLALSACGDTTSEPSRLASASPEAQESADHSDSPPPEGATELPADVEMLAARPPSAPPQAPEPGLAGRLAGRYVLRKESATIQRVPLLGDTPAVNTTYGLATIEVSGDTAELVEHYCHSTSTSEGSIETTIPDAVPRAMGELRQPLTVSQQGGAVRWSRPEVVRVVGATLANPRTDALPTSPTDARVTDPDTDGHPGVTVSVQGFISGQIYLVQRLVDRYAGELSADGALTGLLTDASNSQVVDASNPLLRTAAPVRPDPDASKSTVLFVPISAEMTCDALVAAIPRLFPGP